MIRGLLTRWQRARARRAAIRELQDYDDLQLRDLGITRDEIAAYVADALPRAVDAARDNVIPFPARSRGCDPRCCQAA